MTDCRFNSLDPLYHPMNHRCRVMHRLRRSIGPMVFIHPVEHAHTQKLEEDVIPVLPWDSTTQLFTDLDHVSP